MKAEDSNGTAETEKQYDGSAWAKVVSASVGSTITALAVTPLEVVKVRQQNAIPRPTSSISTLPRQISPCPLGCGTFVLRNGLGEYLTPKSKCGYFDPVTGALRQKKEITESRGTLRMLRSIFVNEGLSGIYAGLMPTLVMGVPNTIIYFYSYEELASKLRHRYPTEASVPAVAGASARFVASLSTAPFELLRTQQAARVATSQAGHNNIGMIAEFRNMIRSDGFLSLFRGVYPTLLRDVPFSAVYWVSIETMRDFWRNRRSGATSAWEQAGQALVNGCVSGTIAAAVTTPLDVLKTRSQVGTQTLPPINANETTIQCDHAGALAYRSGGSQTSSASGTTTSQSTLQIARSIVEEEGITGLWRGNTARILKVAPACAIMISSYEIGKRILISE